MHFANETSSSRSPDVAGGIGLIDGASVQANESANKKSNHIAARTGSDDLPTILVDTHQASDVAGVAVSQRLAAGMRIVDQADIVPHQIAISFVAGLGLYNAHRNMRNDTIIFSKESANARFVTHAKGDVRDGMPEPRKD